MNRATSNGYTRIYFLIFLQFSNELTYALYETKLINNQKGSGENEFVGEARSSAIDLLRPE